VNSYEDQEPRAPRPGLPPVFLSRASYNTGEREEEEGERERRNSISSSERSANKRSAERAGRDGSFFGAFGRCKSVCRVLRVVTSAFGTRSQLC